MDMVGLVCCSAWFTLSRERGEAVLSLVMLVIRDEWVAWHMLVCPGYAARFQLLC